MKLIEALKVIRDECSEHGECDKCPLRIEDGLACGVTSEQPNLWKLISNEEEIIPRVFD